MKKLAIFVIGFAVPLFLGLMFARMTVHAEPIQYNVTFQSMFDADNMGIPHSLGAQPYHSTIQFDSNVSGATSPDGDYVFAFWIKNGVVRKDLPVDHVFIVVCDLDVIAVFSKTGEHAVLFMDSNAELIEARYVLDGLDVSDTGLTLPDKPGYIISTTAKWNKSIQNIVDDTVITLQYERSSVDTFNLAVTNGSGSGAYIFNAVATVVANETGTPFSHWVDPDGVILSTESTFKFSMLMDKEVTAIFSSTPEADLHRITISEDLGVRPGYHTYLSQFYLPVGYKLIDYGMLTSTDDKPIVDFETSNILFTHGFKYYAVTNEFVMSFLIGSHYSVRAYMVVENGDGTLHTTYSELNPRYIKPVDLGTAGDFVILTKTGITATAGTLIKGNVGVSPIAAAAITGFDLTMDASGTFALSDLVIGKVYAADYASPTPVYLETAITDMHTAYTDAAGRAADFTDFNGGSIGGVTLSPGVYLWNSALLINADVTLSGSASDIWIFQITGAMTQAADIRIILTDGAVAENVVWQVTGAAGIGAGAHFEGTILAMEAVTLAVGATYNGKIYSQTAATLDGNAIN